MQNNDLIKELSTNFIEYAASVNSDRAIPNATDGLIKINSYDYGLWIEYEDWYYSGIKM